MMKFMARKDQQTKRRMVNVAYRVASPSVTRSDIRVHAASDNLVRAHEGDDGLTRACGAAADVLAHALELFQVTMRSVVCATHANSHVRVHKRRVCVFVRDCACREMVV